MTARLVEALRAGTATAPEVFEALGFRVDESGKVMPPGARRWLRLRDPVYSVDGALALVRPEHHEAVVREAMALPPVDRPVRCWGNDPVARRICIVALSGRRDRLAHAAPPAPRP